MNLDHPHFETLLTHWKEGRRDGEMVTRRSAIKPEALKSILPMVALFDWTPPDQLVYRLQGTMLADRSQHDLTGMNFIDYVGPETAAALRQAMPGIVSQPCACQFEYWSERRSGAKERVQLLMLPLSNANGDISIIIDYAVILATEGIMEWGEKGRSNVIGGEFVGWWFHDLGFGVPN